MNEYLIRYGQQSSYSMAKEKVTETFKVEQEALDRVVEIMRAEGKAIDNIILLKFSHSYPSDMPEMYKMELSILNGSFRLKTLPIQEKTPQK